MLQVAAGVAFEFILKDVSKTPEEEQSRPHARNSPGRHMQHLARALGSPEAGRPGAGGGRRDRGRWAGPDHKGFLLPARLWAVEEPGRSF